jgi:arginine-tRNA-protein transferase
MQSDVDTRLVEYRAGDALKMVSVLDQLADGLSAVYTFYDPEPQTSYGTYAVLWQVERCLALGLPYLYLGYWIRDSRKMAYKSNFQPLERYVDGAWKPF